MRSTCTVAFSFRKDFIMVSAILYARFCWPPETVIGRTGSLFRYFIISAGRQRFNPSSPNGYSLSRIERYSNSALCLEIRSSKSWTLPGTTRELHHSEKQFRELVVSKSRPLIFASSSIESPCRSRSSISSPFFFTVGIGSVSCKFPMSCPIASYGGSGGRSSTTFPAFTLAQYPKGGIGIFSVSQRVLLTVMSNNQTDSSTVSKGRFPRLR